MDHQDNHRHEVKIRFADLFRANGKFTCMHCGKPIVFEKSWMLASKITGFALLAYLIYNLLANRDKSKEAALINMAFMVGALLIYIIVNFLIIKFASYKIDENEIESRENIEKNSPESSDQKENETKTEAELTDEQKELSGLYDYYAKMNLGEGSSLNSEDKDEASYKNSELKENTCDHIPDRNWKNYVPGMMEFSCEKCGSRISFQEGTKKKLNLMYTFCSLILLYPMFDMKRFTFLHFTLIALGLLLIMFVIQLFMLKKAEFEEVNK